METTTTATRTTMKQNLSDILLDISWARLSVNSNGGEGGFSETEKIELRNALKDLANRINKAADKIE